MPHPRPTTHHGGQGHTADEGCRAQTPQHHAPIGIGAGDEDAERGRRHEGDEDKPTDRENHPVCGIRGGARRPPLPEDPSGQQRDEPTVRVLLVGLPFAGEDEKQPAPDGGQGDKEQPRRRGGTGFSGGGHGLSWKDPRIFNHSGGLATQPVGK